MLQFHNYILSCLGTGCTRNLPVCVKDYDILEVFIADTIVSDLYLHSFFLNNLFAPVFRKIDIFTNRPCTTFATSFVGKLMILVTEGVTQMVTLFSNLTFL